MLMLLTEDKKKQREKKPTSATLTIDARKTKYEERKTEWRTHN